MKKQNQTTDGLQPHTATLLQMYDLSLSRLSQRVGIDRAASTLARQRQCRRYVEWFLADELHRADIGLGELRPQFIHDFANYLSAAQRLRAGTVWLACQHLKGAVTRACHLGLLASNPFYDFHAPKHIRAREFLTEQELKQLMALPLDRPQLALARDVFVFSALTGMAFIDIKELRLSDVREVDGEPWVMARRHKTGVPFQVKLLPTSRLILQRYAGRGPVPFASLQYRSLARNVGLVMQACGFGKHITFHCARHTFAVMALNAGMPIESVSRILGHQNITTTQIYAKITMTKLSADMTRLGANLSRVMAEL